MFVGRKHRADDGVLEAFSILVIFHVNNCPARVKGGRCWNVRRATKWKERYEYAGQFPNARYHETGASARECVDVLVECGDGFFQIKRLPLCDGDGVRVKVAHDPAVCIVADAIIITECVTNKVCFSQKVQAQRSVTTHTHTSRCVTNIP